MTSMDCSGISVSKPFSWSSQSSTCSILGSPDFAALCCSSPSHLVPETPIRKHKGACASWTGSGRRVHASKQDDSDDDSDLPVTPCHSSDFQVICSSASEVSTPDYPIVLAAKYFPAIGRKRACVTSRLVFTSVFQGIKVWLDMEDQARKRQEIRQLLLVSDDTAMHNS